MSEAIDANVLLYASDEESPRQPGAHRLLEATDIVHPRGLLDVIVDFGQTATVSVAGLVVDHGEPRTDALERRIHTLANARTGWE